MTLEPSPFLTAEWLHLAMLNYEIDPAVLRPLVPEGTELDACHGRTLVSLVGFLFRDTRVWGLAIPFHRHFEEVNLRFYVRRETSEGVRRGVVFVKEFVPRRAVAWTARTFYGENYAVAPMGHRLELDADPSGPRRVEYWWRLGGRETRLHCSAPGPARFATAGSEEEFVTENYWGYSGGARRRSIEYRVDHPRWRIWPAAEAGFSGDAARLYGASFVDALSAQPTSAFIADGSAVTVFKGTRIAATRPADARHSEHGAASRR